MDELFFFSKMKCLAKKPKFLITKLILLSLYLTAILISIIDLIYFTPKHNSLIFVSDFPSIIAYYSAFVVFLVNIFAVFFENTIVLVITTSLTSVFLIVIPALILDVIPCLVTYFNLLLIIIVSIVYIVKIQSNNFLNIALVLNGTPSHTHTMATAATRDDFEISVQRLSVF